MKRNVVLIMVTILLSTMLSACAGQNSIVGEWYNAKGKCLDIRDDGSWKLEDSYGTGTWKKLDDDIFEFTDFYGDTQESAINEDELGKYIDFGYYGVFYKDEYPPEDKIADVKSKNAITIDPFENLSYEVSGISPYCKITINNSACSAEIQKYITFSLDKDYYANGEVAKITATLSANTDKLYLLENTETAYTISEQPEYITSLDNVDLSLLKQELSDAINAQKSQANGGDYLFNLPHWKAGGTNFKSCDNMVASDIYFLSLKTIKLSEFDMQDTPFNQIAFTYSVDYTWENTNRHETGSNTFWVNINAGNIIKCSDGSIKWGYESSESYDFNCSYSQDGLEDCITTTIINNSDNYNISKVES